MVKHCRFYLGNEPAEGGGNFTLQAGVTPSQGVFRFPLRASFTQIVTMTLTDGFVTSTWPNCRVIRSVVTSGGSGGRWREVTIHDRRWAWADGYAAVYGQYNRSNAASGQTNQKSARELAEILLQAMGQQRYDVTALPTFLPGPSVDWDAANPASELQILCETHGCIVTLSPNNAVVIYAEGYGQYPRSDNRQMDFTQALEAAIVPQALVFEGGFTQIEHDIPLVPVGLEITGPNSGQFVGIEELSYRALLTNPKGWGAENAANFNGLQANVEAQQAAQKHIWRTYRISGSFQLRTPASTISNKVSGGKLTPSQQAQQQRPFFRIKQGEEWRILPLNSEENPRIALGNVLTKGTPAKVVGYYYTGGIANTNTFGYRSVSAASNADASVLNLDLRSRGAEYTGNFTLDETTGIVTFDRESPVFFHDANNGPINPAMIRLRTSFPIRDHITKAPMCQQFWQMQYNQNTVAIAKIIKQSDVYYYYDTEGNDNEAIFLRHALTALNRELYTYRAATGYSAPHKGFVFDKPPDGVIRATVFDVSEGGGGTTHIDYNMERPEAYFTLREARNRRLATYVGWTQDQEARRQLRIGGNKKKP